MGNRGVYGELTLSDDAAIESILTDIPLFCVGVLSVAVFTIQLVLKRVDQLSVFIFVSSFLGFIAAILDLGQILVRGHANAASGTKLDDVAGFINGREVLLSLSIGTIFFFWWKFSGRRPFGITETLPSKSSMHCASWQRWGFVGFLLQWSSLLVCIVIVILQVVWRLELKHHLYGSLYVASATLETAISAIFILKLCLNVYLSPPNLQSQVFLNYVTPALALFINAGLGVGNLVLFAFSETALGRFLRAIEVYTIIVYYLIMTFRPTRSHKPTSSIEKLPISFDSNTRSNPRTIQYPRPTTTLGPLASFGPTDLLRPWRQDDRGSVLSRVSSWLTSRRASHVLLSKSGSTEFSDKEAGMSLPEPRGESKSSGGTTTPNSEENRNSPSNRSSISSQDSGLKPPILVGSGERPLTEISLSYYAMERDIRTSFKSNVIQDTSTINSDSPVYGLDGILPPKRRSSFDSGLVEPPTAARASRGLSPIDQLFKQQSELDRSISQLRGLHNRPKFETDQSSQYITVPGQEPLNILSPSSVTLSKPSSASGRSDFSLSIFPEPPAPEVRAPSPLPRPRVKRITPRLKTPRIGIIPIQIPGLDSALPSRSPSQNGLPSRFDSAGTQYDVTSFIGGLTVPDSSYSLYQANASSDIFPSASTPSNGDSSQSLAAADTTGNAVSEKSLPSTLAIRPLPPSPPTRLATTLEPSRSPSTPSPTLSRGLGSATMSSSFKVQNTPLQISGQTSPASSATLSRSPSALAPFLKKAASARTLRTTDPGHSKSSSASTYQSQAQTIVPF